MASSDTKVIAASAKAIEKPKSCSLCCDTLTDDNRTNEDERVCRLCFRYAVYGTGAKCARCGDCYDKCTCPCRDCGEPADTCYCHYTADPIAPICSFCGNDPCECERREEWEEASESHEDMKRCVCGVHLTGFEGWGGYCSRDCANYAE